MFHNLSNSSSCYTLKLTSIGNKKWQLFIERRDDSSDYVRLVYGITEQTGGSKRTFQVHRSYIICPNSNDGQVFLYEIDENTIKNSRVWVAFEQVKRIKGKKGVGVGKFIALSPAQSKWKTSIGSKTQLEIKPIQNIHFDTLIISGTNYRQNVGVGMSGRQ